MESDDHKQTSEKPNDGDEQGGSKFNKSRSYECNFCKRGFSNAQALGGHMNIHRKDKAKLKQTSTSNQTQPSLDWHVHVDETHVVRINQLPLFVVSPTTSSETQKPQGQIPQEEITTQSERTFQPNQSLSSELDLELRLGPDPEDSSATKGTRKFF